MPDNLKSGISKACRYEPGVNITYEEMARHYGVDPRSSLYPWSRISTESGREQVNVDCHVQFDGHRYSVPYTLAQLEVEIRGSDRIVEIFHQGVRVTSHARSSAVYRATTIAEHRPKAHQRYLEWTPSRLIEWSAKIGPETAKLVEQVLASKPHPEQGFRSCMGIIRLGEKYPHPRMEAGARRALALNARSYPSLKAILANNLDGQAIEEAEPPPPPIDHANLRGPSYHDGCQSPNLASEPKKEDESC